jgi:surface polysaccharide O-acyltransferase-like enzyme
MDINRYHGFDYLRGIACMFILLWHSRGIDFLLSFENTSVLAQIIYYNFCLLAVPIFFQISLFLTYGKGASLQYIKNKKVPQLLKIYLFWTILGAFAILFLGGKIDLPFSQGLVASITWILQGGIRIELYFLISLILMTVLLLLNQFIFIKTARSLGLQFTLLVLSSILLYIFKFAYWHPLNFTPYIFSSLILYELCNRQNLQVSPKRTRMLAIMGGALFMIISAMEWLLLYDSKAQFLLPPYSRLSLVIGSALIVFLFMRIKHKPTGFLLLVSSYSLGIYCIHFNFIYPVNYFNQLWNYVWPSLPAKLDNSLTFLSVLLMSIFLVFLFRRFRIFKGLT